MKRLEFQDGNSSKFWEAEIADADLTVRWGRIGTSGQSKTKTFANATAALKEHDKLVKEKLAKGYAEAGTATSASTPNASATSAPSVATKSAPKATPASDAGAAAQAPPIDVVVWTDAARRAALPFRGQAVQVSKVKVDGAFAKLRERIAAFRVAFEEGLSKAGSFESLQQRALGAFDDAPPERLAAEVEGAAFVLFATPFTYQDRGAFGDFVHYWVAKEGLLFAIEAWARSSSMQRADDGSYPRPQSFWLSEDSARYRSITGQATPAWKVLRRYLAAASDTEFQDARALIERLRPTTSLEIRCGLTAAFGEADDWAIADAEECLTLADHQARWRHREAYTLLLSAVRDSAKARDLIERGADMCTLHDGTVGYDLVARLGNLAAEPLSVAVLQRTAGQLNKDEMEQTTRALALIHSATAGAAFARLLERDDGRAAAADYFSGAPRVAIEVLSRSDSAAAKKALKTAIAAARPWLDSILESLDTEQRARIEQIAGQISTAVEAGAAELPSIIVEPPWQKGVKPATLPAVNGVKALDEEQLNESGFESEAAWKDTASEFLSSGTWPGAAWIRQYPAAAAHFALCYALDQSQKQSAWGWHLIQTLLDAGHESAVLAVATRLGPAVRAAFDSWRQIDPRLLFPKKMPEPPAFFVPPTFSRPVLKSNGKAFGDAPMRVLGQMLMVSELEAPYAGLHEVKTACTGESLAAFAWDLFEAFRAQGYPGKQMWAFRALGLLGNDESARRITPLIRAWPGESAHQRAVVGLDVLAAIGTDVALMHLHGISQKLKFKGLQDRARDKIAEIAELRGLTAAELADRLVPDLGLDDDGSLVLDFGPRKFSVGFDESLKPFVWAGVGERSERLDDLPKPKKTDDAAVAGASVERFKALKKDARTIASAQVLRLELCMCSQRRWTAEQFQSFFVDHPLLIHLVRRLVWGIFDDKGSLVRTFRVAEDRSFADVEDATLDLGGGTVGLCHALELGVLSQKWGDVFADYELLQPFTQVGRESFPPTDAERAAKQLERWKGVTVPVGKVLGLEQRGWRRGGAEDGGVVPHMLKPLSGERYAYLELDPGLYTGALSESPEQKLTSLSLSYRWNSSSAEPLGVLSPVEFSELVRDVERLKS